MVRVGYIPILRVGGWLRLLIWPRGGKRKLKSGFVEDTTTRNGCELGLYLVVRAMSIGLSNQ